MFGFFCCAVSGNAAAAINHKATSQGIILLLFCMSPPRTLRAFLGVGPQVHVTCTYSDLRHYARRTRLTTRSPRFCESSQPSPRRAFLAVQNSPLRVLA